MRNIDGHIYIQILEKAQNEPESIAVIVIQEFQQYWEVLINEHIQLVR
jgi:hypothetical protein